MSNDLGIVGLGVMGANLALNLAEKNFQVAVFNRTTMKTVEFLAEHAQSEPFASRLHGYPTLPEFAASLKVPRKVFILVQAGPATTETIARLQEVLSPGDILIDTGNAHFKDQTARAAQLEAAGLRFLGMGISGGAEGARKGPAFFPGGTPSTWAEIRPIVEAAAAKAPEDGRPCVTFNGRGGAGSCVKMYHNAGEYAVLQIWAEVLTALRALGHTQAETAAVLSGWAGRGFLRSYMLDITIAVCRAQDAGTSEPGVPLLARVRDCIGSKGTGLWSVQEALAVGVPAPSLAMAVLARQMTMCKPEREANAAVLPLQPPSCPVAERTTAPVNLPTPGSACASLSGAGRAAAVEQLYHATQVAILASYAQMFQCLRALDVVYGFGLDLPATIASFRAGCILQGHLLGPMAQAFVENPNLSNLLVHFHELIRDNLADYRAVMGWFTARTSLSLPVLSASLTYVQTMCTPLLEYGQVVALQRDVFGRHGYERLDRPGVESFDWPELQ